MLNLRNRKHFLRVHRVLEIETRVEIRQKREIAWEHEHEVRVFPRNFDARGKCFLFPLSNRLLKTIKNIHLFIFNLISCLAF